MFIGVKLADSNHLYEYINTSFIYAIERAGNRCKLVMANRYDCLVIDETVEHFLSRISRAG